MWRRGCPSAVGQRAAVSWPPATAWPTGGTRARPDSCGRRRQSCAADRRARNRRLGDLLALGGDPQLRRIAARRRRDQGRGQGGGERLGVDLDLAERLAVELHLHLPDEGVRAEGAWLGVLALPMKTTASSGPPCALAIDGSASTRASSAIGRTPTPAGRRSRSTLVPTMCQSPTEMRSAPPARSASIATRTSSVINRRPARRPPGARAGNRHRRRSRRSPPCRPR